MKKTVSGLRISCMIRMILVMGLCFNACPAFCDEPMPASDHLSAPKDASLSEILDGIENKYHHAAFATDFNQSSTLKAMQITDTASGHAVFKYPGMMKWEYDTPEKQSIITDGKRLWIYRPDDNQVTIGAFPSLFGEGRGAGFLSNIGDLRKQFQISKITGDAASHALKLIPKNRNPELSVIILKVSRSDFAVQEIVTRNVYEDETRIILKNQDFSVHPESAAFRFVIPDNADIVELD